MAVVYVRGLKVTTHKALTKLAQKKQNTKKPSLSKYAKELFESHTKTGSKNGKA